MPEPSTPAEGSAVAKQKAEKPEATEPTAAPEPVTAQPRSRSAQQKRQTALIRTGALLAVVLLGAGLAIGALLQGGSTAPVPRVATAEAQDGTTGATLDVTVTTQGDGVDIEATVGQLKNGVGYRLEAATADGRTWHVLSWTGNGKMQGVNGHVGVPLASLVSFTVARAGGGAVVVAHVSAQPGSGGE